MNEKSVLASSLPTLLDAMVARRADAPALRGDGISDLSYGALSRKAARLAALLRRAGVGPQDRVAVVLPNGPAMAVAFVGTASCAVCAPLNPGFKTEEFRFYLQDIRARCVLLSRDERGPIRAVAQALSLAVVEVESIDGPDDGARDASAHASLESAQPGADDVALLLHTSGTTSRPKIVPLTHGNLVFSGANISRHLALSSDDVCLNVMPLFHIHGLVGVLLASLAAGSSVVCTAGFDEQKFFAQIARYSPTWYSAVPTIHQRVVALGEHYRQAAPSHRFRFVRSSSASLPGAVFAALEALTGAPVIEAYGMTEATHQMTSNSLPPGARRAGSVGMSAGAEVVIMDDAGTLQPAGGIGQIAIRGPGVIRGYLDNPQANASGFRNGWFLTGDQGRLDETGRLTITGRIKEIVNRGGEKIAPLEIDEALLACPDITQAVAFAAPHPTLGEDLLAAVVMMPGVTLDEAALRARLFERLAAHKVPSRIIQVATIPKGPTGKVQRLSLNALLAEALNDSGADPQTQEEIALATAFASVLGRERIGVGENFFWLGGDSLSGSRLIGQLNAAHGIDLPAATIFRHPTVAALAPVIAEAIADIRAREAGLSAEIDSMSDEQVQALLEECNDADIRA